MSDAQTVSSKCEVRFHEDVWIWNQGVVKKPPPISATLDMKGLVIDVAMYWPAYDFGKHLRLEDIGAGCMVEVARV